MDRRKSSALQEIRANATNTIVEFSADGDFAILKQLQKQRLHHRKYKQSLQTVIKDIQNTVAEIEQMENGDNVQASTISLDQKSSNLKMCDNKTKAQLFALIDKDDTNELIIKLRSLKEQEIDLTTILHRETGLNILQHAVLRKSTNSAMLILDNTPVSLILQRYKVTVDEKASERSTFHMISESGEVQLARKIFSLIDMSEAKSILESEIEMDVANHRARTFTCMHISAFYGHREMTKYLIDCGVNVNISNSKSETPCFWAARGGHADIVQLLLDEGADPNISNDKGTSPLYVAIRYNLPSVVDVLLKNSRTDVNQLRKVGFIAPIILSSVYGYSDITEKLIKAGADVNVSIRGGDTALHLAVTEGHLKITKLLIENGADVNQGDEKGNTPLILAVIHGNADIVDVLMENHADLSQKNSDGKGMWHYALTQDDNMTLAVILRAIKKFECYLKQKVYFDNRPPICNAAAIGATGKINFMIDIGLSPHDTDGSGNNAIHYAAIKNNISAIHVLKLHIDLDAQNNLGDTALHLACFYGNIESIDALLALKARADLTNRNGRTALHFLTKCPKVTPNSISNLLDYMVKMHSWDSINAQDIDGNSALHIASMCATPEIIWQLGMLAFRQTNKNGCTPFHTSIVSGKPETLQTLLDIYEEIERDADLNITNDASETVLHLAADAGDWQNIGRLIIYGADLAAQDSSGYTVLHRLAKRAVDDEANQINYERVLDVILKSLVRWWITRKKLIFPYDDELLFRRYNRKALRFLIAGIKGRDNLTVLNYCSLIGCRPILEKLLMVPNVNIFTYGSIARLDISYLTPITSKYLDEDFFSNISCVEILANMDNLHNAENTLNVTPLAKIEMLYANVCAWTYAFLMITHLFYMGIYTWLSLRTVRAMQIYGHNHTEYKASRDGLFYVAPVEPGCMLVAGIIFFYKFFRRKFIGIKRKRSKFSFDKYSILSILKFVNQNMSIILGIAWSCIVYTWLFSIYFLVSNQIHLLAISLWFGWLYSISFTRGFKHVHYFWRMLKVMMVRDMLRFLFIYFFVLAAFGVSLHAIFQMVDGLDERLHSVWGTMFYTFNLMLGMVWIFDMEVEKPLEKSGFSVSLTKGFIIVYLVLSTVVLMNVLIAMMNDSYQTIKNTQSVLWRVDCIRLGLSVESYIPWVYSMFTPLHVYHSNIDFNTLTDKNANVKEDIRWFIEIPIADLFSGQEIDDSDISHKLNLLSSQVNHIYESLRILHEDVMKKPIN